MISVSKLLYKLDQRLNKVATADNQNIPLEDQVLAIQEAEIKLQKLKVGTHNSYGTGFESSTKRYMDLENFISTVSDKPKKEKDIYTFPSPNNIFIPLHISLLCSTKNCKERQVDVIKIVPHTNLSLFLNSPNWKPSFAHQETIASIENNKFSLYTKDFQVDKYNLTYLRYPKPFDAEGYIDFENNPSVNRDSEYKEHLEDELLDLAVLNLALSTNNQPAAQASQIRISPNE